MDQRAVPKLTPDAPLQSHRSRAIAVSVHAGRAGGVALASVDLENMAVVELGRANFPRFLVGGLRLGLRGSRLHGAERGGDSRNDGSVDQIGRTHFNLPGLVIAAKFPRR